MKATDLEDVCRAMGGRWVVRGVGGAVSVTSKGTLLTMGANANGLFGQSVGGGGGDGGFSIAAAALAAPGR